LEVKELELMELCTAHAAHAVMHLIIHRLFENWLAQCKTEQLLSLRFQKANLTRD